MAGDWRLKALLRATEASCAVGGGRVARNVRENGILCAGSNRMKILNAIINLLKGGSHAGRAEESVSGRDGRERRILHSIPSICERAISDICGIRMLAAACADERSRDSRQMPSDPIRQEGVALIAA